MACIYYCSKASLIGKAQIRVKERMLKTIPAIKVGSVNTHPLPVGDVTAGRKEGGCAMGPGSELEAEGGKQGAFVQESL